MFLMECRPAPCPALHLQPLLAVQCPRARLVLEKGVLPKSELGKGVLLCARHAPWLERRSVFQTPALCHGALHEASAHHHPALAPGHPFLALHPLPPPWHLLNAIPSGRLPSCSWGSPVSPHCLHLHVPWVGCKLCKDWRWWAPKGCSLSPASPPAPACTQGPCPLQAGKCGHSDRTPTSATTHCM